MACADSHEHAASALGRFSLSTTPTLQELLAAVEQHPDTPEVRGQAAALAGAANLAWGVLRAHSTLTPAAVAAWCAHSPLLLLLLLLLLLVSPHRSFSSCAGSMPRLTHCRGSSCSSAAQR
jgi:hypothetical protein